MSSGVSATWLSAAQRAEAEGLVAYINASPSPFHAVEAAKALLVGAGFAPLSERAEWDVQPNGKYFVTRNNSTLVAFAVGGKWKPGNAATMIGAHTDSPCLKVKPQSKVESQGYLQVGVEVYGGGLWHTWFDRDLTLAGRVITRHADGTLKQAMVDLKRPILRIPSLAIHLNREVSSDGFKFNNETHLLPVLASAVQGQLAAPVSKDGDQAPAPTSHHPLLMKLLADALQCSPADIVDFELSLADAQPAVIGGALDEYIFAPRCDNLFNAYTATKALIASMPSLADDDAVRIACLFDHEEVGSQSAHGAASLLMYTLLTRLNVAGNNSALERALAKSFLISADQAHAVHPNFSGKHADNLRPKMNSGVVVKFNANQRYATTSATAALLRVLAAKANVPLQEFATRNDMPCGSTIGPIVASGLGVRTIDVGCAMLSMHSIREMAATADVLMSINLFKAFYDHFTAVDATLTIDA